MGLVLSLILAASLLVRTWGLTSSPPELFGDEIDVGYQAASLLATGRDIRGNPLPVYIHSIAEWRAPLLIYATVPSIWLFGNTTWGVRLPEVIFGSLAPVLLLLLVYQHSKSLRLGILASCVLSFAPWHIHYSRSAFEVVLLVTLLLAACNLFFRRHYALCSLLFALTLYTYSTAIIFTPLFILLNFRKPKVLVLFALVCLPMAYHILFGQAAQRFGLLGIANQSETQMNIANYRQEDGSWLGSLLHNKYESVATHILYNYLSSFSTEFLFIRGDTILRHNSPNMGEFLPLTFPFFVMGVFVLFKHRHWFWLSWLWLSPLPAALTYDGGTHATRLFLMVIPVTVAIAHGLAIISKRYVIYVLLVLLVQSGLWLHFYHNHYPQLAWRWWHVGYQSAFTQVARLAPQYSHVFINNTYEPTVERFAFWTNYSPRKFQHQFTSDARLPNIARHYDGFSLDGKYHFGTFATGSPVNLSERLQPDSLYLLSHRDEGIPYNTTILQTISDPTGSPLFYLVIAK